ncbi:TldD/PmbA family protein [Candidatus Micrarchaeota archaeon]|nr:TldD/PmbA family protein [Candidatus Micrarchaeota archaeon]
MSSYGVDTNVVCDMEDYLRMLHSLGVKEGEIFWSRSKSLTFQYAEKQLKVKNLGVDEGLGIRVLEDKRIGFSFCNIGSSFSEAVMNAREISKSAAQSEFRFAEKQEYKKVECFDKRVAEIEENELKEKLDQVVEGIEDSAAVSRIICECAEYDCKIANSSLLSGKDRITQVSVYAEAKDGEGMGSAEYSSWKMPLDWKGIGERAGIIAKEMSKPKRLEAGSYDVIFSHELLGSLVDMLLYSFSGDLKRRKISKLWDKEGVQEFHECLCISDDPFADGSAMSSFDGEGVASRETRLVENGVVTDFYYDGESAAFAEVDKKGNCSRGSYRQRPGIGDSNTVVGCGMGFEKPRKWVEIESMHGLHTANLLSGDFGAEVSTAFLHENGKRIPVRGFMVSGNIFELFRNIGGIGRRMKHNGSFISPEILFRGIRCIS